MTKQEMRDQIEQATKAYQAKGGVISHLEPTPGKRVYGVRIPKGSGLTRKTPVYKPERAIESELTTQKRDFDELQAEREKDIADGTFDDKLAEASAKKHVAEGVRVHGTNQKHK